MRPSPSRIIAAVLFPWNYNFRIRHKNKITKTQPGKKTEIQQGKKIQKREGMFGLGGQVSPRTN